MTGNVRGIVEIAIVADGARGTLGIDRAREQEALPEFAAHLLQQRNEVVGEEAPHQHAERPEAGDPA